MIATLHRQTLHTTLALTAVVGGFGCNRLAAPASPASPAKAPNADESGAGARIVGTVVLLSTGKAPTGGGVVYLEGPPKQPGVATTATIDVFHKEFTPFLSVITTGGIVTFGNKDALTHHVFSPDVEKWDTGYIQKNDTVRRTFDAPGAIALLCNIHPEMVGYLLVIPSTYFGKLSPNGKYLVANAPPGTYRATAWAPRTQSATQWVTVASIGAVTANFELRAVATAN